MIQPVEGKTIDCVLRPYWTNVKLVEGLKNETLSEHNYIHFIIMTNRRIPKTGPV